MNDKDVEDILNDVVPDEELRKEGSLIEKRSGSGDWSKDEIKIEVERDGLESYIVEKFMADDVKDPEVARLATKLLEAIIAFNRSIGIIY